MNAELKCSIEISHMCTPITFLANVSRFSNNQLKVVNELIQLETKRGPNLRMIIACTAIEVTYKLHIRSLCSISSASLIMTYPRDRQERCGDE